MLCRTCKGEIWNLIFVPLISPHLKQTRMKGWKVQGKRKYFSEESAEGLWHFSSLRGEFSRGLLKKTFDLGSLGSIGMVWEMGPESPKAAGQEETEGRRRLLWEQTTFLTTMWENVWLFLPRANHLCRVGLRLSSKRMCPRELPGEDKWCSRQTPKEPCCIHTS